MITKQEAVAIDFSVRKDAPTEISSNAGVVNTRRLQFMELSMFMMGEYGAMYDGVCFTDIETATQYSFNHAVELFNNRDDKNISQSLIENVKLRYCKKSKRVICTNHLVRATENVKIHIEELKQETQGEVPTTFDVLYSIMKHMRLR